MKRVILLFAVLFIAGVCYSQNYLSGKMISSQTFSPGTYRTVVPIPFAANGTRENWKWAVAVEFKNHEDTTKHSYIQMQQLVTDNSGGVNWIDYAGLSADSMKTISSSPTLVAWEDVFGFSGRKLALKTVVGASDTVTMTVWYTLIK